MNQKTKFLNQITLLPTIDKDLCLHRLTLLLAKAISPTYLNQTKKLVITGSDGKGSTATITNSILQANDITIGLFTSPHFLEFNERFRINGIPVDYTQLNQAMEGITKHQHQIESDLNQTFCRFEILFILALTVFERNNVQTLIFEAGIGGRFDPVRLLQADLTALTSVALEHTALLGNTKALIACDKLDACRPGGKTVIGHLDQAIKPTIYAHSTLRNVEIIDSAQIVTLNAQTNNRITLAIEGQNSVTIDSPLSGKFQHYNIQTAMSLCLEYFDHQLPADFMLNCKAGIEQCTISGRFEKLSGNTDKGPELYIDSAHTPEAYTLLFDTIADNFNDKPLIFIAGISQGRDNQLLADNLKALGSEIIVTKAHFRGADPQELFTALKTTSNVSLQADLSEALKLAKQKAQLVDGRIFVVGGLFLAREVAAIENDVKLTDLYL